MNSDYALFGLNEYASLEDIKVSYRNLSKKYHPNSNSSESSTEKFLKIKEIYDNLLKTHIPKKSPIKLSEYEKYYRILDNTKVNHEIFLDYENDVFEKDVMLFCMWNSKEFRIKLPKETKLPTFIIITNSNPNLRLKILKDYE